MRGRVTPPRLKAGPGTDKSLHWGKSTSSLPLPFPLQGDADAGEDARESGLRVQEIDAYWLQRALAKAYGQEADPMKAQAQSEQVRKGTCSTGCCCIYTAFIYARLRGSSVLLPKARLGVTMLQALH